MRLELPKSLHYPITIQKIDKRVGDDVSVRDSLFTYSYVAQVEAGERYTDEVTLIDKIFVTSYNSPFEGVIEKWFVWEGDVVTHCVPLLDLIEPCKHSVQFNGMCTECGKDMTGIEYAGSAGTDRAPIQIAHDTDKLLVSHEEANDEHEESKKRLLASRKLSLVVDLDQTIIHAAVDPTIGEWQNDPENPNYEAVKDVRTFQLKDDGPSMRGCWYYIKMRPGLEEFLENVAERYELHIYTMGTRQYAEKISEIVDPDKRFFSNRVLSRDESGSMTVKSLTRLFPVDDKMVVIIDDRADVWKWWPNLVRVSAFDFFPAIGDINGALLPKKQELLSTPKPLPSIDEGVPMVNGDLPPANGEHTVNGQEMEPNVVQRDAMAAQQQIPAVSDPDIAKLEEMQKTQEETLTNQLEEKPLLRLQQRMDEQDGLEQQPNPENVASGTDSESTDSEGGSPRKRHSILRNDDEELIHLERHLRVIHDRFFNEYDRKRAGTKGGRVAALAGKRKAPLPEVDPETSVSEVTVVPDTKKIIPAMKERVLDGVTLVFSSVIPLGADVHTADISMWARSFGAIITDKVGRDVTHVIAARPGTAKVKTAVKRGIPVVSTHWLMQSIQRWKKLDVKNFLLPDIGQRGMEKMSTNEVVSTQEFLEEKLAFVPDYPLSSDEDTAAAETDDDKQPKRKKLRLDYVPEPPANFDDQVDYSPTGDVESPVEFNADEIQDMQDELAEFMGSDMESDSDAESVRSERSIALRERKGQKRRRDDNDEGDSEREGENADDRNGTRPLAKLQKGPGGSALRAVSNAQSVPGLAPQQTQEEYDADLAEELARELEDDSDEEEDDTGPTVNGSADG